MIFSDSKDPLFNSRDPNRVFIYSTIAVETNGSLTKRISLTETFVQNLLTVRAKSFLHTSKQKKSKKYTKTK